MYIIEVKRNEENVKGNREVQKKKRGFQIKRRRLTRYVRKFGKEKESWEMQGNVFKKSWKKINKVDE